MSDLWARCHRTLRLRLSGDEWERSIRSLHAWVDDSTLYLWVDPELRERLRASILHRVRTRHTEAIRKVAREISSGRVVRVRALTRAPNRERIVNERRTREHRETEHRRQPKRLAEFRKLCAEEHQRLLVEGLPPWHGTAEEQARRAIQLVETRALARLEKREQLPCPVRAIRARFRGPPPEDPPPWPPPTTNGPSSRGTGGSSAKARSTRHSLPPALL